MESHGTGEGSQSAQQAQPAQATQQGHPAQPAPQAPPAQPAQPITLAQPATPAPQAPPAQQAQAAPPAMSAQQAQAAPPAMSAQQAQAAPSGASVLSVRGVLKTFGEKRAVDQVSLEVAPGDIFGFVGPNGAGKTTLIRCIVGITSFDAGDICIAGASVQSDELACKRVTAYVPDNPDIYEFLTGIQYLDFIADFFEIPQDLRRERIKAYADRLGLTASLGDLISSYSHGMRQKLVLIGALVHEPTLLVLDEPFVGLDPEASYHVKAMLRELAAHGSAVFFSSHVLEVVEKLCNKVALIKDGALRACGPTAEVVGDESLEEVFLSMVEHGGRDVAGAQGGEVRP